MQAISQEKRIDPYHGPMNTGRPPKRKRTPFGERLHALREAAGLSQQEVANRLGITQPAYALWERRNVSVRVEQLYTLADILGVAVEDIFYQPNTSRRKGGPVGKARRIFEQVNRLPRTQQHHVLTVVEAFVKQNAGASS